MSEWILPESTDLEKTWAALSQQRLAWAFRAYNRFIDSLSDDVREHFPKGDEQGEAYVVVFGKTQVGKTTLILDLMGLSGDSLKRVSSVLRGGRESGKSATATAMEYRRSSDNEWRFFSGAATASKEPIRYDDTGMEKVLSDVRQKMFEKHLQADKPFIVWIPNDCFDGEKNADISVRMLDLPGDQAADAIEREHVQQMAKKYVPNADLILLVGRGDDLSFLRPSELELPDIEDWQIMPNRFRIVTTYSFTVQSVRDAIRQEENVNADFFRTRLLDQIQKFELKLENDAANTQRFFPLEFGDSWGKAKEDLVNLLKPVITGLKDQLHKDIKISATQLSRLRNAVDVHVTVGKIKEIRLKQIKETLNRIKEQRESVSNDCKTAESAYKEVQDQINKDQIFIDTLKHGELERQAKNCTIFDIQSMRSKVDNLGTNTIKFKYLINQFTSYLRSQFLISQPTSEVTEEKKFWASVQPRLDQHVDKVEKLVDEEFKYLRNKLSNYSMDEYYPSLSDDFLNDKKSMHTHMQKSADSVRDWAATLWQGLAKQRLQQLSDNVASNILDKNALEQALKERKYALEQLDIKTASAEQECSAFIKKMEADKSSCSNFMVLLDQAYFDELGERQHRIAQAPTATYAFIELLAAKELINERNKLLNILS